MVFNSGANRGFWRVQLRDRFGKFVKMGGAVTFEISLPGVKGIATGHGYFIGNSRPGVAKIEVRDNKRIPKGVYEVDHKSVTAAKAIIDFDAIKNGTTLKKKISGAEAQKKRMKSVVTLLRGEGRFPIPRQTTTGHWGNDSDIARGAIADYSAVYEKLKSQDPSWEQKYKTFDEFWERVKDLSVEGSSQSPNDLSKIPQEMKDINKAYAEEILDLEPDGLITFYRNATNNRLSAAEAARGYVSTNADFAYDYNANAESTTEHNGRYEIDAKPEEVYGMLGYSKLEDEFAVVLGDGVTTQEGRVRKVGELKPPEVAPWLTEANNKIDRGSGSTVFRHFAIGGQYDFYPVDEEMSDLQAMFKKYNFGPEDIKKRYDERYGDGSYDRYKASGETVTTGDIKRFFVPLGDGKVGFDPSQFSQYGSFVGGEYGDSSRPETFENDKTDNLLKMFSVLQDLTGQNFMVHKSHTSFEPPVEDIAPAEVEKPEKKTGIFNEYAPEQRTDADKSNAAEDTRLTDLGFDPEEEITVYRGVPKGVTDINPGDWVTTLPQLAKDYAGDGEIISTKVKAKDLLADPSSGEGAYTEEMVYRPVDSAPIILNPGSITTDQREEALEEADIEALEWYTDFGFAAMARYLRQGEDVDPEEKAYIDRLLNLINATNVTEDSVVYRGIAESDPALIDMFNSLNIGDIVKDPGIASSSYDIDSAMRYLNFELGGDVKGRYLFKINVPKGSKAYKIDKKHASYAFDNEVLLPPGTALKLTNVTTEDGRTIFEVDIVDI